MKIAPFLFAVSLLFPASALAAADLPPVASNVSYGPHECHVFDLWLPQASDKLSPLVVFIHGGGFVSADKSIVLQMHGMLERLLAEGYAVASINYRYCGPGVPLPEPMRDAGRAVQFLRTNASRWHLDARRVALCGGSAGAGIALWLAFHDDLAEPDSADPVARESTRVSCAFVWDAQTSYDPTFFRRYIGGHLVDNELGPVLYQMPREEFDTPIAHALFREISPIEHAGAGDPPVMLYYEEQRTRLPPDAPPSTGAHHPAFGPPLQARVQRAGGVCLLRHKDDYVATGGSWAEDIRSFLERYLR
ncbi:MAG: alpha/beta hydrolase [Nocardioides sp.]